MTPAQLAEFLAFLEDSKVKPPNLGKRGQGYNEAIVRIQGWLRNKKISVPNNVGANVKVSDERIGEYR